MGRISKQELSNGLKAEIEGKASQQELNEHKADYEYQTATVVSRQIRLTKQSNTNRLQFKLNTAIANGTQITISLDGGVTSKPLQNFDGTQVTELDAGFVGVVEDTSFFTLRPRGGAKLDGNATVGQVLAGATFYNNDAKNKLTGTMPNRGIFNLPLGANVPAGYYSGGNAPSGKRFASGRIMGDMGFRPITIGWRPRFVYTFANIANVNHVGILTHINSIDFTFQTGSTPLNVRSTTATGFTIGYGESTDYDWYAVEF